MNNYSYLFYQPYQHFSDNFTIIGNATEYCILKHVRVFFYMKMPNSNRIIFDFVSS